MHHGIKQRLTKLKEARMIIERQEYAIITVPGCTTIIEIDTDPVLAAIDKEIAFLEGIING